MRNKTHKRRVRKSKSLKKRRTSKKKNTRRRKTTGGIVDLDYSELERLFTNNDLEAFIDDSFNDTRRIIELKREFITQPELDKTVRSLKRILDRNDLSEHKKKMDLKHVILNLYDNDRYEYSTDKEED